MTITNYQNHFIIWPKQYLNIIAAVLVHVPLIHLATLQYVRGILKSPDSMHMQPPPPNTLPFTLAHTIGPIHYWNSDQKLDVLGRQYHDIIYTRVITEPSMPMHMAVTGYIGFIQSSAIAMWPLSCSITAGCPVTPLTPGLRAARHISTAAVKCQRRFRPLPH